MLFSFNMMEELMKYMEEQKVTVKVENNLEFAVEILKMLPNYQECDSLKFLVEQITLSAVEKNNRRYNNQTMVLAACLYVHSPSAYKALLKCGLMYLPHPRNLQKLICNFQLSTSALDSSATYLESRLKYLKSHERLVCLLVDEIYILPQMSFKGGQIYGASEFDVTKSPKTAQVFMVSSVLSKYKDVVAIVPVNNMSSLHLKDMIMSVLTLLEKLSFKVIAIVSDNNSVNRKAFELFAPNKILQPSISHPLDSSRLLFFIFDTVHILKCIRNNWETQKSENRTICYPDMNDSNAIAKAQYRHLELMYEIEKKSLVKYGHTLSNKALYPSSIQKQNVNLALKILNENNVVALQHIAKNYSDVFNLVDGTCSFIDIFVKWWKIVNVKSAFDGKRFNDTHREPIRAGSDLQIKFLNDLSHWLKIWRVSLPIADSLSAPTFQALITTTDAFIELIPYLFGKYKLDYILLGKFQSYSLESRFSTYRQDFPFGYVNKH